MNDTASNQIQATGDATGFIPRGNQGKPITVIGTTAIQLHKRVAEIHLRLAGRCTSGTNTS